MSAQAILDGQCVLNTRPLHQQAHLKNLLEADGAKVLSLPSIEIAAIEASDFHLSLKDKISLYQMLVFVSRNAVEGAFQFIDSRRLPEAMQLAVIGEGTF